MLVFAAHTSYQKRFNKVLSFVVMGASEYFLHLTTMSCMKYINVCVYVFKTTTDDLYTALQKFGNALEKWGF